MANTNDQRRSILGGSMKRFEKRFEKGVRVIYVPTHAHGDFAHKDCEHGVVSSINVYNVVFVKFDPKNMRQIYITGDEDVTAQGCRIEDLITENEARFIKNV